MLSLKALQIPLVQQYVITERPFRQTTWTRATAKKPTSTKTAHPVETLLCYNILLHQWDLQRF